MSIDNSTGKKKDFYEAGKSQFDRIEPLKPTRPYNYGRAPVKAEGGIADPDEWTFQCHCGECQELRKKWQADYEEQQKQLRGEA